MGLGELNRHMPPEERFWKRVRKDATGCWLWTGPIGGRRYAQLKINGRNTRAHRWAYEHFVGPIPEGLTIDHICGVTICVNPEHLRALTSADNSRSYWLQQRKVCRAGHVLAETATIRLGGKSRICLACERERRRRWRGGRKAKGLPYT